MAAALSVNGTLAVSCCRSCSHFKSRAVQMFQFGGGLSDEIGIDSLDTQPNPIRQMIDFHTIVFTLHRICIVRLDL
jgi:hypothetical protein